MGLFLHPATLPLAPALPASHDELHQCTSVPATCSGAANKELDRATHLEVAGSNPPDEILSGTDGLRGKDVSAEL